MTIISFDSPQELSKCDKVVMEFDISCNDNTNQSASSLHHKQCQYKSDKVVMEFDLSCKDNTNQSASSLHHKPCKYKISSETQD